MFYALVRDACEEDYLYKARCEVVDVSADDQLFVKNNIEYKLRGVEGLLRREPSCSPEFVGT